jgi:pimeloyl-ACP methyl ester carboxylesterase
MSIATYDREMRTFIRVGLALLSLLATALVGGGIYQRVAELRDDDRHPPPGELHSVDGRSMHIRCRGSGSPTIIVEQGIGGPSIDWNDINARMSRTTRVCDYDRAGMGHSEPAYRPTRSTEVAKNLNALLRAAKIEDDLILVGWSAGGMYAREYYRQFPERVKGMVLVDSPHEQTLRRMPPQPSNRQHLDSLMHKYYLAQIGWIRLTGEIADQYAAAPLAAEDKQSLIAFFHKSHVYRTLVDEGVGLEQDLAAGLAPPGLGDLPVIVLAEGKPRHPYMTENLAQWHQLQRELAGLSSDGHLVIATESAHFIHRTEPELLLKAVNDVVESARTGRRLGERAPFQEPAPP